MAILMSDGNSPVSKQRFINSESQKEKNSLKVLSRNIGMPNGPEDLDESRRSITLAISSGPVAERKKEHMLGFISDMPLPVLSFLSVYLDSP